MKFQVKSKIALIALLSIPLTCLGEQYGAEICGSTPISVTEAIATIDTQRETSALVKGEVTSVCQAKGCWMGFSSEAGDIRITFKDYGYFVPFSIMGKTVLAEGTLEKRHLTLIESKHLVEDAGGNPASVTEPIVEYHMIASGVRVQP